MMAVKVLRLLREEVDGRDTGTPCGRHVAGGADPARLGHEEHQQRDDRPGSPTATKVACQGMSSPTNGSAAEEAVK